MGCRKLFLHFDNSKRHTTQHVQEQITGHWGVRVPHR
jgi:hypothetical protein